MQKPYALYLRKSRADLDAELRGEGETLSRHAKRTCLRTGNLIYVDFGKNNK